MDPKIPEDRSDPSLVLRWEFAQVISSIMVYAYGLWPGATTCGAHRTQTTYLQSEEFRAFWHGRLGNMVSNWYFFRQDQKPELLRMHKHPLCGLDPSWARLTPLQTSRTSFEWSLVPESEKSNMQIQIDEAIALAGRNIGAFTITLANWRFRTGDLWCSQTERRLGWIFVPLGELLLYSFEYQLLEKIAGKQSFPELLDGDHGELDGAADEAWEDVVQVHGHGEQPAALVATTNDWLYGVLKEPPHNTTPVEYQDWWEKEEKDWFILASGTSDLVPSSIRSMGPRDWALGICRHSKGYPAGSRDAFWRRARFSPNAERIHRTRNLLVFPLWADETFSPPPVGGESQQSMGSIASQGLGDGAAASRRKPILTSPFSAFFVSTFYDSWVIEKHGEEIRALLSAMAQPDITRFAGEAVLVREQSESLRYYARGLAHDLRSIASSMEMTLHDMREQPLSAGAGGLVKSARQLTYLIGKVAQDYHDYARSEDLASLLKVTDASLREIVEQAAGFMRVDPSIKVFCDNVPRCLVVRVDRDRILRVILNVLLNAKDAMFRNVGDDYRIDMRAVATEEAVYLQVADRGCGIAEADLPRVFVAGFTTKHDRERGLGLVVSRQILDAHRSKLGAGGIGVLRTSPGNGTTIEIELPRPHGVEKEGTS